MAELTDNINYLQPTGFKVVIDRKKFGNLEFFAQSISHPSVGLAAAPVAFSRVNLHMGGDKLQYGSLTITAIMDENMTAYSEMYEWFKRIVQEKNTTKLDASNRYVGQDVYTTAVDITLSVLSSHNNTTKRIRYIDCIPTDLGSVEFLATTADIQYLTFNVTFEYSYFELI